MGRYSHKAKLLGVCVDQHLAWKRRVDHVLGSSYETLSILHRLKNLAPFHVRKRLAENLVLSKVNYAYSVFHPLSAFRMKRLQRLQNACAVLRLRLPFLFQENQVLFGTRQHLLLISFL